MLFKHMRQQPLRGYYLIEIFLFLYNFKNKNFLMSTSFKSSFITYICLFVIYCLCTFFIVQYKYV